MAEWRPSIVVSLKRLLTGPYDACDAFSWDAAKIDPTHNAQSPYYGRPTESHTLCSLIFLTPHPKVVWYWIVRLTAAHAILRLGRAWCGPHTPFGGDQRARCAPVQRNCALAPDSIAPATPLTV
jgi:hypothetical protein